MSIKKLAISGYKSIEGLSLTDLDAFSIFAGANGAGKSNVFDAIIFASEIIKLGSSEAILRAGGYEHIHCFKLRGNNARRFEFALEVELEDILWSYHLKISDLSGAAPTIEESLHQDQEMLFVRKPGQIFSYKSLEAIPDFPGDRSALLFAFNTPFYKWITNVQIFRIDPYAAKKPNESHVNTNSLDSSGQNVASVLSGMEKNPDFRETILEFLELVVPGFSNLAVEREKLSGQRILKFSERGTKGQFPANLISDGTIYLLCILTAILSRSRELGITLIEEPERGINPKPIEQIVVLMRDLASNDHPIWVTSHNEALVRNAQISELLFVSKLDGKTVTKSGKSSKDSLMDLPLDKAWLSNMFDGGLPW